MSKPETDTIYALSESLSQHPIRLNLGVSPQNLRMIQPDVAWTLRLSGGGAILCRLRHSSTALNIVGFSGMRRRICHPCLTGLMKGLSVSVSQIRADREPEGWRSHEPRGVPSLLGFAVVIVIIPGRKIIEGWAKMILELNARAWHGEESVGGLRGCGQVLTLRSWIDTCRFRALWYC